MKNIFPVFLLFLLVSCNNSEDKTISDLIIQNNRYYQLRLEEYELETEALKMDCPICYERNQEYYEMVFESTKKIAKVKTQKTYDTLFEKIKIAAYENKAGREIKAIHSANKELLKNNLYVNLMNVIQANKRKLVFASTHCQLSPPFKIKKRIENDSVKLDFYIYNSYQFKLDSIVDGTEEYPEYTSDKENKVWSLRYKPKSKTSSCHGKIFFQDPYPYNYIHLQTFDESTTK